MVDILLQLMEICDLLTISDGVEGERYAIGFATRKNDVIDYIQGDDLAALLIDAFEMCRERAAE